MQVRTILKKLNNKHLNLCKGAGYWYFTYDDPDNNIWESYSICVFKLNQLSLEQWIAEGEMFIVGCEEKIGSRK